MGKPSNILISFFIAIFLTLIFKAIAKADTFTFISDFGYGILAGTLFSPLVWLVKKIRKEINKAH